MWVRSGANCSILAAMRRVLLADQSVSVLGRNGAFRAIGMRRHMVFAIDSS
jgi:hypothetical protein